MAETWYWRSGTGAACGPGTRRPLNQTAGTSAATQDVSSEHTWNRTESARTIAAGNWSVFADLTTASGGGAPNRVTIVIERRNSSCVVQQTIGTVEVTMSAGTTQEYTFDFGDPGQVAFSSGDILTCRIIRSNGTRAQTLRFDNAATTDADSRLVHPDIVSTSPTRGQVSWAETEVPNAPTRGQVSWAETEVPLAPTRGQVSWAETEVPIAPTRGQLSWTEAEVPSAPTRGQVSFSEFEVPDLASPTRGQISFAEGEFPLVPTRGLLSWAEVEVPDEDLGYVSFSNLWPSMSYQYRPKRNTRFKRRR